MNLREYLEENDVSIPEFAQKLEISKRQLQRFIYEGIIPKLTVCFKIMEITAEKVTMQDIIDYIPIRKRIKTTHAK